MGENRNSSIRWFALIAFVFGLVFCFLTPPFQVPDELLHFHRAYSLTDGQLFLDATPTGAGANVPKSIMATFEKTAGPQDRFFGHPDQKMIPGVIYDALKIPLAPEDKSWQSFTGTGLYTPITYLPSMVGVVIGRVLNASPLAMLYLCRIAHLFAWIGLIILALRWMPWYRWTLALLALTPMAVFIAAGVSPDSVTYGVAAGFTAYCLRLAYGEVERIERRHLLMLTGLTLLLAMAKPTYLLLSLLYFLIPVQKFTSPKSYWLGFLLTLAPGVVFYKSWTALVGNILLIPLGNAANPTLQIQFLTGNPQFIVLILINAIGFFGLKVMSEIVGCLGRLDTPLPAWLVLLYFAGLIYCARHDGNPRVTLSFKSKLWIAAIFIGVWSAINLLIYIIWSPVAYIVPLGVQGRYISPVALLPLLLLYRSTEMSLRRQTILLLGLSLPTLIISTYFLMQRFY